MHACMSDMYTFGIFYDHIIKVKMPFECSEGLLFNEFQWQRIPQSIANCSRKKE